ncbi:MAG: extracellular solute-binding protein, partial [Clostridia bacterium]|nr:extracellular solute-binding protein [Clostridia bacterium]
DAFLNQSAPATDGYALYLEENSGFTDAAESIVIKADSYTALKDAAVEKIGEFADEEGEKRDGVIKSTGEKGEITYKFTVAKAGFYTIKLSYCPIKGRGLPLSISFLVDGKSPYESLNDVNFERTFKNESDGVADNKGNVYAPEQIETFIYKDIYAMDKTGQYTDPLKVSLAEGEHTITLVVGSGEFNLAGITLDAPEKKISYAEYKKLYEGKANYTGKEIQIEGETAKYKSTSSMNPFIDNSDPSIKSVHETGAFKEVINFIGSTGWQTPNETLVWDMEVPEDGFYKVAFRFRQDQVINGNSYRSLKIDGKSPFAEAEQISFYYGGNWKFQELTADGEAALVYLTKGKHEVSMVVTMGAFGEISRELTSITYEIRDLYLKIRMITGDNIDSGRSYEFFEQIPGFNETLDRNIASLEKLCERITEITGEKSGTYISTIQNMVRVMHDLRDNPYTAQRYISTYYDNYCSLAALVADIAKLPLDIDQIIFAAPEEEYEMRMASWWNKTIYSFERFIVSFMDDYKYSTDNVDGKTTLTIWVVWGRDQTQILTSLVKDSFETQNPNVNVNIQIVGATLVQAILSGTGPDVLIGQPRTEPVNYGMRGALVPLNDMPGYDEVITRFQSGAVDPYVLNGVTYGIPDTQSFSIMFYRTDTLQKLGLTEADVPKTWDEFRNITALMQRQNFSVGMPGAGVLNYYSTFLRQKNIDLYKEGGKATNVTEGDAVTTFVYWTDFYTNLGYQTAFSFYNRFRDGTMPLGVATYADYVLFSQAAPEISGKWAIAPLPGTMQEDGTINYTQSDTVTCCVIPIVSKHPDIAWDFIKWWTHDDTQFRYSTMVEAVLGEVGRVQTANIEAIKKLSWESDDLEIILDTWEDVEGLVEVPGGYYVTRSIYQAFWNVVNLDENPKDMIVKWGKVADEEIVRKRKEYGLEY